MFCDEWTIYDNRVAIQQNIDEWDDRPWQQRRRLALSYRFMSRWDGKYEMVHDRGDPADVRKILENGKMELLGAYCLGDEECTDYAWTIFADAIHKAKDPRATLYWIGWQYADLGFSADAAEALGKLCSRFNDEKNDLLLAFTDGIPDARNNADKSFGREHLRSLLNPDGASPDKLLECIGKQVHQFIGAAKQFDDITLLAVKRNL